MPATSAVLTGLSLATGIAHEATDGVPVVKQVLGVASRIVGLAEQVDKNREDLQALADRAKKMDRTITAIVTGREVGDNVLRSLEDINGALRAVETYFENHLKRSRVHKTLGYIFTARKDVDRLKGELDDRLRELEVAANIDTNIFSRENSRFIGEFRNIRHCEITLLRAIARVHDNQNHRKEIFHLANCEGSNKVFVVRSMTGLDEHQRQCIEDHRRILERLSLIQNRHPAIACLYGWNIGPKHNRFAVLEAGDLRPLEDALRPGPADIAVIGKILNWQCVNQNHEPETGIDLSKDVSLHLQKHGAAWWADALSDPVVYVDSSYNPTIGIDDDLYSTQDSPARCASFLALKLGNILCRSTNAVHAQDPFADTPRRSVTWINELFGMLIKSGYRALRRENIVRRAEISSLIPFSQDSWTYLHEADRSCGTLMPEWGSVLLRLAAGSVRCEGSLLEASYNANSYADLDVLTVYCLEGNVEVVYHAETRVEIPRLDSEQARQRLGIKAGEGSWVNSFLRHPADYSPTSTERSGWVTVDKQHHFSPW